MSVTQNSRTDAGERRAGLVSSRTVVPEHLLYATSCFAPCFVSHRRLPLYLLGPHYLQSKPPHHSQLRYRHRSKGRWRKMHLLSCPHLWNRPLFLPQQAWLLSQPFVSPGAPVAPTYSASVSWDTPSQAMWKARLKVRLLPSHPLLRPRHSWLHLMHKVHGAHKRGTSPGASCGVNFVKLPGPNPTVVFAGRLLCRREANVSGGSGGARAEREAHPLT